MPQIDAEWWFSWDVDDMPPEPRYGRNYTEEFGLWRRFEGGSWERWSAIHKSQAQLLLRCLTQRAVGHGLQYEQPQLEAEEYEPEYGDIPEDDLHLPEPMLVFDEAPRFTPQQLNEPEADF